MFWVTDAERVIGDQHNQPCSFTMDKWKERKEEMESLKTGDGLIGASVRSKEQNISTEQVLAETHF